MKNYNSRLSEQEEEYEDESIPFKSPKMPELKPAGVKTRRGRIAMHFVITCAICEKFSIEQHDSLVSMENSLVNDTSKFRLSRESSWWPKFISNGFLQEFVGMYFAWKLKRKYYRYVNSVNLYNQIFNE